jgi:hypothetical protein
MLVMALVLAGCGGGDKGSDSDADSKDDVVKTQEVKSPKSSLTIEVPEDWSNIDEESSADASITMQAKNGSSAILIIEEKTADFDAELTLDKYSEMLVQVMQGVDGSSDWQVDDLTDATVGDGVAAKQRTLSVTMNGVNLKYLQTVFKTSENFVEILEWSTPSNFDKAKPQFDEMLKTVKF